MIFFGFRVRFPKTPILPNTGYRLINRVLKPQFDYQADFCDLTDLNLVKKSIKPIVLFRFQGFLSTFLKPSAFQGGISGDKFLSQKPL